MQIQAEVRLLSRKHCQSSFFSLYLFVFWLVFFGRFRLLLVFIINTIIMHCIANSNFLLKLSP